MRANGRLKHISLSIVSELGQEGIVLEDIADHGNMRNYDLHPDDRRFLTVKYTGGETTNVIQVVLNGFELVKRVAPTVRN